MARPSSIDQLNHYLRGELAAVETYRIALDQLADASPARGELERCLRSHQARVRLLQDAIRAAGGTPAERSGAWGVFARAVERGASLLGDKLAVAALEEGEDHGRKDYEVHVAELDTEARTLVSRHLLPEQRRTHDRMRSLKHQLAG